MRKLYIIIAITTMVFLLMGTAYAEKPGPSWIEKYAPIIDTGPDPFEYNPVISAVNVTTNSTITVYFEIYDYHGTLCAGITDEQTVGPRHGTAYGQN